MIFVTGSSGLVGSLICKQLISSGHSVKALRRSTSDMSMLGEAASKIEWVEGDINDIELLNKCISEAEYVIHSAAIISFVPSAKKTMYKINVEGTANVVNACLKHSVKKLLHISSIAALGRTKDAQRIDETAMWENSEYNSNYAVSKYQSELEVWRGIEEGLNTVIVNPSVILGPGDWDKGSTKMFKYVWDQRGFYTTGSFNYVDVRDVAEMSLQLLFSEANRQRYVLNGGAISYKELFEKVAFRFNKKAPSIETKPWMGELALIADKIKSIFSGKEPTVTREILRNSTTHFFYPNDKVCRQLNRSFRSLDETLEWCCGEIRKKYSL